MLALGSVDDAGPAFSQDLNDRGRGSDDAGRRSGLRAAGPAAWRTLSLRKNVSALISLVQERPKTSPRTQLCATDDATYCGPVELRSRASLFRTKDPTPLGLVPPTTVPKHLLYMLQKLCKAVPTAMCKATVRSCMHR